MPAPDESTLEFKKLALERYKAKLDFYKFMWGSVFAAIAAVAIPAAFQYATAHLEYVKNQSQLVANQQSFRETYIQQFVDKILAQDVEVRIRLADYMSFTASDELKSAFKDYATFLRANKTQQIIDIDNAEEKFSQLSTTFHTDNVEIEKVSRQLARLYRETGYVPPNRSVNENPRAPDTPNAAPASVDFSFFKSGLLIDTDGICFPGCKEDHDHQDMTGLRDPITKQALDSSKVNYVGLPAPVYNKTFKLGDFLAVYNTATKTLAYAILGDISPLSAGKTRPLEGSVALAKSLGLNVGPHFEGGVNAGIVYVGFPNSRTDKQITQELIDGEGKRLFEAWGGLDELQRRLKEGG